MDTSGQKTRYGKGLIYLSGIITIFLWSSAFTASKYTLRFYSPEALMLIRFSIASATLGVIGFAKKISLPRARDIPLFAFSGFIGIFLYMWLYNNGLSSVDTGVASFIIASVPVFTIILSRLLLKETVTLVSWIGVGISFCGLFITTISQTTDFSLNIGVAVLLLAAFTLSGYNILQRKLSKTYTALEATTYSIVFATCFMLIFLPSALRQIPESTLTANLLLVYLGVFPGAIAYLCWGYLLAKMEKTVYATVFMFLNPFVASVLGHFLLGETFSALSFWGGVTIIAGMLLTSIWGGRH